MGNCIDKNYIIHRPNILKEARVGDIAKIKKILLDGGDINYQDLKSGNTALMIATHSGNHMLVSILLENGSCAIKKNNFGYTALSFAARNGHVEIGRMLIYSFNEKKSLKRKGIDSKSKNSNETPLMQAVFGGHRDFVILLLDNGADLYVKTKYGWTALDFPKVNNFQEIIIILSEKLKKEISHRSPRIYNEDTFKLELNDINY